MPNDFGHGYLSTACIHDQHDNCRLVCKFCHTVCLCKCHWIAKPMVVQRLLVEERQLLENNMVVDSSLTTAKWRVGRKVGRTLYAMVGDEPCDEDILIGMMDSPELANVAKSGHSLHLRLIERHMTL